MLDGLDVWQDFRYTSELFFRLSHGTKIEVFH